MSLILLRDKTTIICGFGHTLTETGKAIEKTLEKKGIADEGFAGLYPNCNNSNNTCCILKSCRAWLDN